MKVIVAGSPKTGTKSMNSALTELGYSVHDLMEHYLVNYDKWMKIFQGKGCIEDFKKMYENVDAVVDGPAHLYWNEIHQAFPDAKVSVAINLQDSVAYFPSLLNYTQTCCMRYISVSKNKDIFRQSNIYRIIFIRINLFGSKCVKFTVG